MGVHLQVHPVQLHRQVDGELVCAGVGRVVQEALHWGPAVVYSMSVQYTVCVYTAVGVMMAVRILVISLGLKCHLLSVFPLCHQMNP